VSKAFSLTVAGETATFTEMLRTVQRDVIKVHAKTHALGVAAEYVWLNHEYPEHRVLRQSLSSLALLTKDETTSFSDDPVKFDVLRIRLASGVEKDIYFDISDFFGGHATSLDPQAEFTRELRGLYLHEEPDVAVGDGRGGAHSRKEPWTRSHRMDAILIVLTILVVAIAWLTYRATPGHDVTRTPSQPSTTTVAEAATTTAPMFQPPTNATCASLRAMRALQDSPPALTGGPNVLVVKVLPHGQYERAVRVKRGETVRFSIDLHNGGYGGGNNVVVSSSLRSVPGGCWKIVAEAHSTTDATVHTTSYPVFLVGPKSEKTRLVLVPRTTILFNEHAQRIATLDDTIVTSTVAIPYTLDGGSVNFVNFDVRVQ
jgi:hypothetical protein